MQKQKKINFILDTLKDSYLYCVVNTVYVYGSFFTSVSQTNSDIDILIIVNKKIEMLDLIEISRITKFLAQNDINTELNVLDNKFISLHKKNYWHNSRGLIFLEEIKKFGNCIHGNDILSNIKYTQADLYLESRKIILSLIYNIQKNIVKINIDKYDTRDIRRIIKFTCYIIHIMLFVYVPDEDLKKINYYNLFDVCFKFKIKAIQFLYFKRQKDLNLLDIQKLITDIFSFIKEIEEYIINNEI